MYHTGIWKKETANSWCVPVGRGQKTPGLTAAVGPCGTLLRTLLPGPTIKPIQSCAKGPHEQFPAEGSGMGTRLLTYLSPEAAPTRRQQKVKPECLPKDAPKCESK